MQLLVVNMEVTTQNKHYRNVENIRFKMRHTPYSNRSQQAKTDTLTVHFFIIHGYLI